MGHWWNGIDHQNDFASNGGDPYGAILVTNQGTLIVRDSAFVQNGGVNSGGIAIASGASADVINTTFARNGGGFLADVIDNFGTTTVINSTFAGSVGAVIAIRSGGMTRLQNTIVVHDSEDTNARDCQGVITSLGNNLIGNPFVVGCNMTLQLGDRIGDAGLGELVDDGTPGDAHYPLLSGSQAIDTANDAGCPKKDQIDQPRKPQCDIGAVEFDRTPSSK